MDGTNSFVFWPLWLRRLLLVVADLGILLLAGAAGHALQPDGTLALAPVSSRWLPILSHAMVFIAVFHLFGHYRRLWRYASVRDLMMVVGAACVAGLFTGVGGELPAGRFLFFWTLATGGLVAVRFGVRAVRELSSGGWRRAPAGAHGAGIRRVLIAGAGDAGSELARELLRHPELGLQPVGFLDDSSEKRGQQAYGLKVLGPTAELGPVARRYRAETVVIAMPSAPGPAVRAILQQASTERVAVRILPSIKSRGHGAGLARQLREVRLEDLLGRPEVRIDLEAIGQKLTGMVVLVTGAGGSIGSELCRQVAAMSPEALVLLGHGENSLYQIHGELREAHPTLPLHPVVADVQDETALERLFSKFQPAVVFHAAAHKHVPLMEANPAEAVKNNALGTYNVASAAVRHGVERFVLISTDKAVNAASVMGATKQVAERIVRSLAHASETVFVTVRFGNVLGSRGSVVPLFQQQIARGGPVTVTHPDATRYFMTIPEAASLVLQAAAMGNSGDLFVLDMGQPVRVMDLAIDLIRLAGYKPGDAMPIEITGLRPGEKVTEELFTAEEGMGATLHERIFRAQTEMLPSIDLSAGLRRLRSLAADPEATREQILAECDAFVRGAVGHECTSVRSDPSDHGADQAPKSGSPVSAGARIPAGSAQAGD